jgi:asparagine synthase (glutamine-hydrolysing)
MSAAVRRQTVSDVPFGVLLSGGMDSALVAQMAARATGELHTYCVGYSADDHATEFVEASQTAQLLGTVHSNLVVERENFAMALRSAIWHLEEPIATTSLVTFSLLCKAVAAERKVVLTGQGADEPWAGYTRHRFEALLQSNAGMVRAIAPIRGLLRAGGSRARLCEILTYLDDDTARWVAYRSLFPIERVRRVFGAVATEDALHRIRDALDWAEQQAPRAPTDCFSRLLVRDSYTDLSDNLLLLSDKLSMAHGLEVRVPLLDVAYASYALSLPARAKRGGFLMRRGKVVHKAVAVRSLPRQIVDRAKKGFETPLRDWFAGDFGRAVRDRVLAPSAAIAGVLPATELFNSVPDMGHVSHELQQQLFSLWVTNEWIDVFR